MSDDLAWVRSLKTETNPDSKWNDHLDRVITALESAKAQGEFYNELNAESATLLARVEALEAGLRPFAEGAKSIPQEAHDDQYWGDHCHKAGDYRQAAALLTEASK